MEIKYGDKTVIIPDTWDDVTLEQYLQFNKVASTIKQDDDSIENTLRTFKLVEILCNMTEDEIDSLSIADMNDISSKISNLITNVKFDDKPSKHFNIDGVDYVAKDPSLLDNGEYISLNILQERHKDVYELFPLMLAVLIRPGKKEYDFERKEEIWEIEKFNRRDILNLELRADIFKKKAKAKDVVPVLNFFLTTKER